MCCLLTFCHVISFIVILLDATSGHQLLDFYPRTDTCQQELPAPACTCSTYTVYIPDMPHVCFPSVRKRLVSQEPPVKKSRSSSSDPDSPDSRVGRVLAKLEQSARLRRLSRKNAEKNSHQGLHALSAFLPPDSHDFVPRPEWDVPPPEPTVVNKRSFLKDDVPHQMKRPRFVDNEGTVTYPENDMRRIKSLLSPNHS